MAKYPSLHATNAGRDLIGRANTNKKAIIYTKAVLGDGSMPSDLDTLTAVVSPRMDVTFTGATNKGDGQYQLKFVVDNGALQNGFYAREVGIMAKLDGENDSDAVLFAYTNGGNYVDYIPNKDTPIDAQSIYADIVVGNATDIRVTIQNKGYVPLDDFQQHIQGNNAHSALFAQVYKALGNYLPKSGGDVTGQITMPTPTSTVKNNEVITAAWVLERLGALATGKITGDVSNPNAWWVKIPCVGFNLLIQGGKTQSGNGGDNYFPISFKTLLGVLCIDYASNDGNMQYYGISERLSSPRGFRLYTSNKGYTGIFYLALGVI